MGKDVDYDVGELLGGNVDSVTAKFGELSDAQLRQALASEKAGSNRSTLIAAIEREQTVRQLEAQAASKAPVGSADATHEAEGQRKAAAPPAEVTGEAEHGPVSPPTPQDERGTLAGDRQGEAPVPAAAGGEASGPSTIASGDGPPPSPPSRGQAGEEPAFVRTYSEAEVAQLRSEHATELAKACQDRDARIASLNAELAEAREAATRAARARPARAVKAAAPRKLALTGEAGRDGLRVAFADEHDMSLPDLPELDFGSHAFEKTPAGQVTLNQPILFPPTLARASVASVWVVDGAGKGLGVSRLVNPLPVGGGADAEIPKGFLAFTGDVPVATTPRV